MRYAAVLVFLMLAGCRGIVTWGTLYTSESGDKSATVAVQETNCFGDCEVRIVVKRGWHSNEIASKADCSINFAHAEWAGDTVSIFVDDLYCGQTRVAFNTRSGQIVDFRSTESWLGNSIIKAYAVTAAELQTNGGDVFRWATYPGDGRPRRSMEDFHRQHPLR